MFKGMASFVLLLCICSCAVAKENFTQKKVLNSGVVHSYRWIADAPSGVRFQLAQRIPDQTRSFYIDKGFSLKAADKYASACVMQTIFNNNTSDKTVTFNLANWRVIHNGISKPIKLRKEWVSDWKKLDVSKSAQIAFHWSQFPTIQKHSPGDWFQGMVAYGVAPGESFDLKITWTENDTVHSATMKNIQCAKDITLGE